MTIRIISLVAFLLMSSCVSISDLNAPVSVYPIGPAQFMVTCVDSPAYCTEQANALCPQGFDVVSNTTNPADYGRMTMVIKCYPEAKPQ